MNPIPTPSVAIVIPVYNDATTLGACLRAVFEHTQYSNWRVIVVDDGSTDRPSPSDVVKGFPNVRLVKKAHGGVASALNVGFAQAPGLDIVRLHADVVITTPDWLTRLVETAYAQPKAGIVGVRLVYPDGRIHSEGRSFISGLGMHPLHYARRNLQPDGGSEKIQEVDSVSGAMAYYRHEVITRVGGMDEAFGAAWMEDDDFCIGARRAGYKVYVNPGIKAVHFTRVQSPTAGSVLPEVEQEIQTVTTHLKTASNRIQADYWEVKWGWHPHFPDLGEIRRLYGETEICWQIGEPLRYRPTAELPTVDCCLVTWNTLGLLRRCLESLALTDYPADRLNVYITDNASTDGTVAYLEELAKAYPFALHLVKLAVNTGAPIGMNFAFTQGQGELVARLDDDIILPPNWLKPMVAKLRARPFAGCIGPKIVNDDEDRSVQCGPYRHFPTLYGHDDESDQGQADYFSRTTHVRGCCNLYRRDVFARCGLLDGRFSPSQFDDPDHHIALLQVGYEILYDGSVAVVHKLNSGLGRTLGAVANQMANQNKLRGKWGQDAYEVLERSIDLSLEGRYLPDDCSTEAWLSRGPSPASFPRRVSGWAPRTASLMKPYHDLTAADTRSDVSGWVDEHLTRARLLNATNAFRSAIDVLQGALNLAPNRVDVMVALADTYQVLRQTNLARVIARHGLCLAPDHVELKTYFGAAINRAKQVSMLERPNAIGEKAVELLPPTGVEISGEKMRVLMVNTYENRLSGGDMHQVKKTKQYLEKMGLRVDVCCAPRPDPRGYDVVHVWNTWFPAQTLAQVKVIRAWRPDMPIVLSPIFWDMREKSWADTAVPSIFGQVGSAAQLDERLGLLASGKLQVQGRTRQGAREANFRGYDLYQKSLLGLVDHLLPQSQAEIANLKKTLGVELPHTLVHNGAETAVFDQATPDWCFENLGIKDFVLTVGLVEPRKNQLMLLHALRDSGLKVVVVGRSYFSTRSYQQLCQKYAPPGSVFVEHLPHEQLASVFKAARVHALPSWMECASFANVEAALSGCALAVSDRTSEKEYFGDNAYYCDPASVLSIRRGVMEAYTNYDKDAPKRARLIEQFRQKFTWEKAANQTLAGYEAAVASRRQRLAA